VKPRWASAPLGGGALLALAALAGGCGSDSESSGTAGVDDPRVVEVRLVDAGCEPAELTLPAGPTSFEVTNDGADAVTEFEILDGDRILGEVENLAPGLSGELSLTLRPGRYVLYCPGGKSAERGSLTVEGSENA
jgi:iron uptake system EfeUOB component EfeO/EfeM